MGQVIDLADPVGEDLVGGDQVLGCTLAASASARGERSTGPRIGRQTLTWTIRAPVAASRAASASPRSP